MESNKLSGSEPTLPRKPWHTPMCTKKNWQTPQLVPISFGQTQSGSDPGPESSTKFVS
jgi:hypothetical protein